MVTQEMTIGDVRLSAEVKITQEELMTGLTGRQELQGDVGMLFMFPHPTRITVDSSSIPFGFDAGFFDDNGNLLEVARVLANSETPYHSSFDNVQFMLEMRDNWFAEKQIQLKTPLLFVVKTPMWMCYDMLKLLPKENFIEEKEEK